MSHHKPKLEGGPPIKPKPSLNPFLSSLESKYKLLDSEPSSKASSKDKSEPSSPSNSDRPQKKKKKGKSCPDKNIYNALAKFSRKRSEAHNWYTNVLVIIQNHPKILCLEA